MSFWTNCENFKDFSKSSLTPKILRKFMLNYDKKCTFPHTPAKSKFFLPLVFTKMLLSAKGMRKNSILTSGENKECRKSICLWFWAFFIFPPVVSNILSVNFFRIFEADVRLEKNNSGKTCFCELTTLNRIPIK